MPPYLRKPNILMASALYMSQYMVRDLLMRVHLKIYNGESGEDSEKGASYPTPRGMQTYQQLTGGDLQKRGACCFKKEYHIPAVMRFARKHPVFELILRDISTWIWLTVVMNMIFGSLYLYSGSTDL